MKVKENKQKTEDKNSKKSEDEEKEDFVKKFGSLQDIRLFRKSNGNSLPQKLQKRFLNDLLFLEILIWIFHRKL